MTLFLSESRSTRLHLYRDGVVVHQSRAMPCPLKSGKSDGVVELRLEQISDEIEDDSFSLTGPEELLSYRVQHHTAPSGVTSYDSLLYSLLGEQVELTSVRFTEDKAEEVVRVGKLLYFNGSVFVALQNERDEMILIQEPIVKVRTLDKLSQLQRFSAQTSVSVKLHTHCGGGPPRLQIQEAALGGSPMRAALVSKKSTDMDVDLSYHSRGMNWSIVYDILLSSDMNHMSITGKLSVVNDTGVSFSQAKIFVVQSLLFPRSYREEEQKREMMFQEEEEQGSRRQLRAARPLPELAVEATEFNTYELPELLDIGRGQRGESQYITFFEQPNIKVKPYYEVDLQLSPTHAYLQLRWLNTKALGAGFAFPPGHYHVARSSEYMGELDMEAIPVGRQVDMRVNAVSQIRAVKEEVHNVGKETRASQQGEVFHSVTYQVTLYNEFEKKVLVRLLEHLQQDKWIIKDGFYDKEKLLFSAVTKKPNTDLRETRLAEASLHLPPQSITRVQYTVEYTI